MGPGFSHPAGGRSRWRNERIRYTGRSDRKNDRATPRALPSPSAAELALEGPDGVGHVAARLLGEVLGDVAADDFRQPLQPGFRQGRLLALAEARRDEVIVPGHS